MGVSTVKARTAANIGRAYSYGFYSEDGNNIYSKGTQAALWYAFNAGWEDAQAGFVYEALHVPGTAIRGYAYAETKRRGSRTKQNSSGGARA